MDNIHTFVVLAYKESQYLEECIQSVIKQSLKTNVIIATSTPNNYIENISKKYNLNMIINNGNKGIGNDFNFAIQCANTELVTIAHQDDIYDFKYAESIVNNYKQYQGASILFTDYYEIRGNEKQYKNTNLNIKRILLRPLLNKEKSYKKRRKRQVIKMGNSICCPAVTFSKRNIRKEVLDKLFVCDFKCNVDWYTWELLSKEGGNFIYINDILMGHRISEESTTSKIIADNTRTKEDLEMFKKFWPIFIAKLINNLYKKSEKSNNLKK